MEQAISFSQEGLGSVRALADDSAALTQTMDFSPYGVPQGSYGTGFGFTGEYTDANDLLYLRARYYAPEMGVFTALDPWEGIAQRPMSLNGYSWVEDNVVELLSFHNRYSYAGSNPTNWTDPSGLCPHMDDPGYQVDARHCNELVGRLHMWNIDVVWDISSIPPLTCLPESVQDTANQAQGIRQRWTTNEVRAIYNAFRIFNEAHERFRSIANMAAQLGLHFPYNYVWPRQQAVTFEKRRYISDNDEVSFGVHIYNDSRIILSGVRWGEANSNMTDQSRSWLALHEFSHIFTKDRVSQVRSDYLVAVEVEYPRIVLEQFEGKGSPTQYSTRGAPGNAGNNLGKEYLIEAVTGTLWNYGYLAVSEYDSGAGGWTGALGQPNVININNIDFTLTNVRSIQGLENWILFNIVVP